MEWPPLVAPKHAPRFHPTILDPFPGLKLACAGSTAFRSRKRVFIGKSNWALFSVEPKSLLHFSPMSQNGFFKFVFSVFRPPVAGIAGKPVDGAYSIVLAGGYEDDEDFGDEFTYTGAGGRDLSGNKRTSGQVYLLKMRCE